MWSLREKRGRKANTASFTVHYQLSHTVPCVNLSILWFRPMSSMLLHLCISVTHVPCVQTLHLPSYSYSKTCSPYKDSKAFFASSRPFLKIAGTWCSFVAWHRLHKAPWKLLDNLFLFLCGTFGKETSLHHHGSLACSLIKSANEVPGIKNTGPFLRPHLCWKHSWRQY